MDDASICSGNIFPQTGLSDLQTQYSSFERYTDDPLGLSWWAPRELKDTACQTSDVTSSLKEAAELKKRHERRARAARRERQRVEILNDAFQRLKQAVPSAQSETRKVDVLKMATQYINDMTTLLRECADDEEPQT